MALFDFSHETPDSLVIYTDFVVLESSLWQILGGHPLTPMICTNLSFAASQMLAVLSNSCDNLYNACEHYHPNGN